MFKLFSSNDGLCWNSHIENIPRQLVPSAHLGLWMMTPYFLSWLVLTEVCFICHTCSLAPFARQCISRPLNTWSFPYLTLCKSSGQRAHHMPPVDAHAMVDHRVLDLVDDGCSGSLNAQSFLHLWRARSEWRQFLLGATPILLLHLSDKHKANTTLFHKTDWCVIVVFGE